MRELGIALVLLGVAVLGWALTRDVSVASGFGAGRVNNLGLMAERQNYIIVGGIAVFAGLLLALFGKSGRTQVATATNTDRPCPLCAEPIKYAAIKCKHCGSDVEPQEVKPQLDPHAYGAAASGWTVRVSCKPGAEYDSVLAAAKDNNFPTDRSSEQMVIIGPFELKVIAGDVLRWLHTEHKISGHLHHDNGK